MISRFIHRSTREGEPQLMTHHIIHNTRAAKPEQPPKVGESRYYSGYRGPIPEEFEEDELPEFDDLADLDFDVLATHQPPRAPITAALERLRAVANEIRAVEGLLGETYERAAFELTSATTEEIPFMSEDGLQSFDVVNELRRAIWQLSQAVNRPALDRAITAVQLAELASDFRE
ncbi:hypothetical protein D3C80_1496240 [compost metagenome]